MAPFPKMLMIGGILMILAGLAWEFGSRFLHLGKLPGDISIERGNFRFYFPFATSVILSLILTILINLLGKFLKK
ncbi:DUF2905 domain-containing protein [Candidatus Sumerlaeota bacterium]|nr:DUF2905 domain-containing protein [Candidatus Sumerlaeota bacterium]